MRILSFVVSYFGVDGDRQGHRKSLMLRLVSSDARQALAKAVMAGRKALLVADDDSRLFWEAQEAGWLRLAESHALVERLKAFVAWVKSSHSPKVEGSHSCVAPFLSCLLVPSWAPCHIGLHHRNG